jgi:hypothetical protein
LASLLAASISSSSELTANEASRLIQALEVQDRPDPGRVFETADLAMQELCSTSIAPLTG